MTKIPECPRCKAEMEAGFMPDWAHSSILRIGWCRGNPKQGWLSEVKARQAKDCLPITVFRCPKCGVLESYAHPLTN